MKASQATSSDQSTRARLLEAAGEVFAEQGFHSATVREICERAGANVASINYYFIDKERLYAEAVRHAHSCALSKYPVNFGLPAEGSSPRERLYAFVRAFLLRIFDPERPEWHGKLLSRELAEPTAAFAYMVEENIRPCYCYLTETLRDLTQTQSLSSEEIELAAFSIVGQCLFYQKSRNILNALHPDLTDPRVCIDDVAEHITNLSLNGLLQYHQSPERHA